MTILKQSVSLLNFKLMTQFGYSICILSHCLQFHQNRLNHTSFDKVKVYNKANSFSITTVTDSRVPSCTVHQGLKVTWNSYLECPSMLDHYHCLLNHLRYCCYHSCSFLSFNCHSLDSTGCRFHFLPLDEALDLPSHHFFLHIFS